jgi:hypothetical protein
MQRSALQVWKTAMDTNDVLASWETTAGMAACMSTGCDLDAASSTWCLHEDPCCQHACCIQTGLRAHLAYEQYNGGLHNKPTIRERCNSNKTHHVNSIVRYTRDECLQASTYRYATWNVPHHDVKEHQGPSRALERNQVNHFLRQEAWYWQ